MKPSPLLQTLSLVAFLLSAWSAVGAERFEITIVRKSVANGLVTGTISVNGQQIGNAYENDALKIPAGTYKGLIRYHSPNGHAQGPLGQLATEGDFLLEVSGVKNSAGKARTDIVFHGGTKPQHSKGCILLGPVSRDKNKVGTIGPDHPLRKLRLLFYGTDQPNQSPDKEISIVILAESA